MIEQEEKDLQKRVEAKDGEIMDADSYIEAINSMKENSVPKDDFLKQTIKEVIKNYCVL